MPRISVHSKMKLDATVNTLEVNCLTRFMTDGESACYDGAKKFLKGIEQHMNKDLNTNAYLKFQKSMSTFQNTLDIMKPRLEKEKRLKSR